MNVTLTRLKHLLAVARLCSFSRAADELHISQPALSRSISLLEEAYGLKVFDRDRGGVSITSAGQRVVREAEALINAARTFDHNVKVLGGAESGSLAIGVSPVLASLILPGLGSYLFNKRPHAELRTAVRSPQHLMDELRRDEIELLYCPRSEVEESNDLEYSVLKSLTFKFVCRAEHPLALRHAIPLAVIASYPIATAAEFPLGGVLRPSSFFLCDNDEITRRMVLGCDAIWLCCPDVLAVSRGENFHVLDVDGMDEMVAEITVVRRKRKLISPVAADAIGFVERLFEQEGAV